MALKYNYDETGLFFYYFLLSILVLILAPVTYTALKISKAKPLPKFACKCSACLEKLARQRAAERQKQGNGLSIKAMLIGFGWGLVAVLMYKVATTTYVEEKAWDPYDILGVSSGATEGDIKKVYRKLSLQYHPDKVAEADKKESESKFVDISKAYKVLTDEDARKNWEEWGNPDGRQSISLGIALPKWLVDSGNSNKVLFVYALVFGLGLPYLVAKWWYSSKRFTKDQILNDTMGIFFREMKETMPPRGVLELLSVAIEFRDNTPATPHDQQVLPALFEEVKAKLQERFGEKFEKSKRYGDKIPWNNKVLTLLHAHLLRVTPSDPQLFHERRFVIEKSYQLAAGMLQIATSHQWFTTSTFCVDLMQMIAQGLYIHESPLMQLPFMTPDILKHCKTKKRNISTVRQLLNLSEEERRGLLRSLEDDQYSVLMGVANKIPRLEVEGWRFKVLGEEVITPGSLVSLLIQVRVHQDGLPRSRRGSAKDGNSNDTDPSSPVDDKENLSPVSEIGTSENGVTGIISRSATERLRMFTDEEIAQLEAKVVSEEEKKSVWKKMDDSLNIVESYIPVHAPHYPADKKQNWWVFIGNGVANKIITFTKFSELDDDGRKIVKLQFQAPPKEGAFSLDVKIKSDSYRGVDAEFKVTLEIKHATVVDDFEDDISEPDEDSLAGQLTMMRSGQIPGESDKGKGKAGEDGADDDDDSDSDDD